ncbi:hypothetical protein EGW08_011904 [Elysia chlorotica]|uniref:Tudor domain-containing protein n=1 Tax=Elysia chlorotica TaxID=188477 RepID=A0A3S1B5G2_ELYCH|nr:hypothetical protein EGW08_011904 [Elysia chlorotica]
MEDYPIDFISKGSTEYVFTTHIKDPEHFYVHVESQTKILDDIMETLAERYNDIGPYDRILNNKRLGTLCAAKFTDDDNWYRAKITGLMNTGLIEVQFVDYGNTDYVSEDRVKSLDADLVQYPIQCYKCALANVKCTQGYWTPESTVKFEDKAMDQRCEAHFSGKKQDDTYLVNMIDGEGNSLNEMFGAVRASKNHQSCNGETFKEIAWQKGAKVQATVAYVQSPDLFWCQDQSFANELLIMSEELSRLHMTQGIQPMTDVRPGSICAAKFSEDEAWYRGVVQSVSNGEALVYFVDYGNTESVPLNLVCRLSPGMKTMPALAAKCCLSGVSSRNGSWDQAVVDQFEEIVVDKEFEMVIVDRKNDTYIVSLVDIVESTDVSSQMRVLLGQSGDVPRAQEMNTSYDSETKEVAGVGPSLSMGSRVETFLTWVESPGDFWVQLKDFDFLVHKLSTELQEFYAQPRPGTSVSPGAFIVAKYSEDGMWYRGLVLKEVSDSEVLVLFIDYGNSDIVAKVDLRQVAPAFGEIVPLAFRCALVGVKPLSEDTKVWTSDAKSFLEEMTQDGCICEVVDETESRKLVQLSVNGKDIATELASLRVVAASSSNKPSTRPQYVNQIAVKRSDTETVTVTHVSSPQDFWCQLNKLFAPLDNLMAKLEAHYSDEGGTPIRNLEKGRACIAQYSEDKAWYRGKILDASHEGVTVQFVDYGNSELVSADLVCEPEPRFLDLPVQAIHCSLPLDRSLPHLADAMTDLVLDKELTMEVLSVGSEINVVELYIEGSKVSDMLKQASGATESKQAQAGGLKAAANIPVGSTVTAFVSYVTSPSKFYVQLADKEIELGELMDEISVYNHQSSGQESLLNPQVNQACMALFSEDNQWYRGIIKSLQASSCNVLFVDYGNEESVSYKDALKILPSEFTTLPALAYECSLEGTDGAAWTKEAEEFFESIIMDQELQCTFLSQKSVKITINGKDIKNELISNGFFKEQKAGLSQKRTGSSEKLQINGGVSPQNNNGWNDSGDVGQGTSGFGSNKAFGSRDGNASSGFGSRKTESNSGFSPNKDSDRPSFGSKGQGAFGFGGGDGQRERKTSTGSSAASGEFTYGEPPSEPEAAILVHMDEDGTFYLQLPSMEKDILFLAKRLAGSYKNGGGPRLKDNPAKGIICCAKFPEDGCMYRCLVLDVNSGTATLRYVDYGNTAECSTRDLKMLFPDLLQYSVQAYPCKLKGLTWSIDQAEKFASATLDQNLQVTFSGVSPPFEVEIKTPSGDLLDILTGKIAFTPSKKPQSDTSPQKKGFGGGSTSPKQNGGGGFGSSKPLPTSNESSASTGRSLPPPAPKICEQKYVSQIAPGDPVGAYICHIDEAGYFYLQLEKDTATLDSIMEQLESLSGQHPDPSTGAACAAIFSEDSSWYRALINSVQGDNLKVTFVDYGNGSEVQKNSVKPLTNALLSNAPLAFQCQFSDIGPLPEEAQKKLSDYLMEHKVMVTFNSQSSPCSVSMTDADGKDLQEIVCPSDCYKTQSKPKNVIPAGVTDIEDDGRFYIQLYPDFPAIAKLHKNLSEAASSNSLEKVVTQEVGLAVCFEQEQGEWRRGQIQKISDESIEVIDVDTGKKISKDADSLFQLPLHFFKNAPYGYECRLKGVESWTDDLRKKFTEMTEEKILNATFHTGTTPFRVSLARSIELDLLGLSAPMPDSPVKEEPTKSIASETASGSAAYISHVDSDGTFYTQLVTSEEDLNAMSEKLEEALASATTGDLSVAPLGAICCAQFTEDDAWYRARVTDTDADKGQITVRFVDYGNTDTVESDRLAALPEGFELSVVPAFATKSRLSGLSDLTEEAVEKLRAAVLDQVVTVEVIASQEDRDEVVVRIGGKLLSDVVGIQVANTDGVSPEASYSQEEFVDASETVDNEVETALNKNTNAEADEFDDAMEGIDKTNATENQKAEQDVLISPSQEEMASGNRMPVTVSFVVDPSEFYFQLDQKQDDYNLLLDQMFEHYSGLPEGEGAIQDLSIGDLCAALYAEDESWYRVCVKDITDGSYRIFFIDHGNTEVAEADTLRVLADQFRPLPPAAKKASLAGVRPATEEWSSEAISEFKEHVEGKSLLADIMNTRNDQTILRLLELGIPVHEGLVNKGYGVASEEDVVINQAVQHIFADDTFQESQSEGMIDSSENNFDKENEKVCGSTIPSLRPRIGSVANTIEELEAVSVYVSCAKSPYSFWCQLSTCIEILKEIGDILGAEYSDPQNLKLTEEACVGDFVIARNLNDGLLYRSKVISVESSSEENTEDQQPKVFLQYIDFGTEGEADRDQMFKMETSLFKFPAQAFKCSLENVGPQQGDSWSQSVCDKFSEVVQDRELSLKLVGNDADGTSFVELIDPQTGQSLSSLLIETGFGLSSVESVDRDTKNCPDSYLRGDTSAFDGLEITRPIMESTAMVCDTTQAMQSFSINDGKDGSFRVYSLSLHTEYDVFVCNEELPNAFHVRFLEMELQYTSLSSEIQKFIDSEVDRDADKFDPSVNDPCLVRVKEMWHRATVLKRDELNWKVKLQDIGTEVSVDSKELRSLPRNLLELPAQAIPCYLAGVVSVEPEWCSGSIEFFQDRTKDSKFSMYVLEDAHKGKYGVVISDLESSDSSSDSSSVNRAMVDLGYAEVVPGSYIDIQLDMEKTLDTDMLNDLEESFNEVSLLKCNADAAEDNDEAADLIESGEVCSYFDSYKEGKISKLCQKKADSQLYQLIQITDSSLEGSKTGNDEILGPEKETHRSHGKHFCLALDVERIEQHGCPDIEISDADMDFLGTDSEISRESSLPPTKQIHVLGDIEDAMPKADEDKEDAMPKADEEKEDAMPKADEEKEDAMPKADEEKEDAMPKADEGKEDAMPKADEEKQTKERESTATPVVNVVSGEKNCSASAPKKKSIYTWKIQTKTSPVDETVKIEAEKSDNAEDNMFVEGEKRDEEIHLESVKNEQSYDIYTKLNYTKDDDARSKALIEVSPQNEECVGPTEKFEVPSTEEVLSEGFASKEITTGEEADKEEAGFNNFGTFESNLKAPFNFEVEWKDLIISKSDLACVPSIPGELKEGGQKAADGEESATDLSFEKIDLSDEQMTSSISPDDIGRNISLEKDLQHDSELIKSSSTSETNLLSDLRKRYMSSTPSRDVRSTKAHRKVKSGNASSRKAEKALFVESTKAENVNYVAPEDLKLPSSPSNSETEIFLAKTMKDEKASEDNNSQAKCEVSKEKNEDEEQPDCEVDSTSGSPKQLHEEDAGYGKNDDTTEIVEEVSIGSGECGSTETSKDQSGNEATQFISCLESDDSHASGKEEEKVRGEGVSPLKDCGASQAECDSQEEKQSEENCSAMKNFTSDDLENSFDTVDEYESCSETGLEDGDNQGFVNSLVAVRGSMLAENLNISLLSAKSEEENSLDPASLFLSGSSFDTSAVTSDTMSTLERGDDEDEDFTPSQLEDDSYLNELMNKPKTTSVSSSSSDSCTSSEETTGQESYSSSLTTGNDSSGLELAKEVVLENSLSQNKCEEASAVKDIPIQELDIKDETNMNLSKEGESKAPNSDQNMQPKEIIHVEKDHVKSEDVSSLNLAVEEGTENISQKKTSNEDSRKEADLVQESNSEMVPRKTVVGEESEISMVSTVTSASDGVCIHSGMEIKRKNEDSPNHDIAAKRRNIEKTLSLEKEKSGNEHRDLPSERGLVSCEADTLTGNFASEDTTSIKLETEEVPCKNVESTEGRQGNLVDQNQSSRNGEIEGSHADLVAKEDGEEVHDDELLRIDEQEDGASRLDEHASINTELQTPQSMSVKADDGILDNSCQMDIARAEELLAKNVDSIESRQGNLVDKNQSSKNGEIEGSHADLVAKEDGEEVHDDELLRIDEQEDGASLIDEHAATNTEPQTPQSMNVKADDGILENSCQMDIARAVEEMVSSTSHVAEVVQENASIEAKCNDKDNDDDEDDAYYEDSVSKKDTDVTELYADEKVLAGAPALDLNDANKDADTVETKDGTEELESVEQDKECSSEIIEKNEAQGSGDEAGESQC